MPFLGKRRNATGCFLDKLIACNSTYQHVVVLLPLRMWMVI